MLVAEDLHWGDADSMQVLGRLAETAHAEHLFVVMTFRDDLELTDMAAFGAPSCILRPLNQQEARVL